MTATGVQELTETVFCKEIGCGREADARRGRYAYLCADHKQAKIDRERRDAPPEPEPEPEPAPVVRSAIQSSLEERARELSEIGALVDSARERFAIAREELAAAIVEWRAACRRLAGDGSED